MGGKQKKKVKEKERLMEKRKPNIKYNQNPK